ncbi:MAG: type III-A CRISPR-associated RAMP protein Csm4 [Phaeodactylibacter sp.]|nr:type III-A CRISPR-associated RAMP protein Csm4 [Phaeodactylibacter sp.]
MKCTIVYLEPRSSFKPALRSDTLWAAICWAIRMVYGEQRLDGLIKAYEGKESDEAPFYLSSAFPYQWLGGKRVPFLPRPMEPSRMELPGAEAPFEKVKSLMREWKAVEKRVFMDVGLFQYAYGGKPAPVKTFRAPVIDVRPMAHNTISRLTGSTLSINKRGQLFHMDERFVQPGEQGRKTGLYFLVQGNMKPLLEGALRFLEHYGIGGDRSTGKGAFHIDWEDFQLDEPGDANAIMALSLYLPTKTERKSLQGINSPVLNYKLEARQGWKSMQAKGASKDPVLFFSERSVLPLPKEEKTIYGHNISVGQHDAGHDIYQYGYGFMVKIKIPQS